MVNAAADHLAELASQILTRWDMEPVNAIFPCSAVREDLRSALEQYRKSINEIWLPRPYVAPCDRHWHE